MEIISDARQRQIKALFDGYLRDPVEVRFYYADGADPPTAAMMELLERLAYAAGGRLRVTSRGGREAQLEAGRYGVEQAPALVLLDGEGRDTRVRFYGVPLGLELVVFLEDLIDVSRGTTRLSEPVRKAIRGIDRDLVIQVFTTPT